MTMQKVLSSLLVVVLGLGTAGCACAATMADSAAGNHAGHSHAMQASAAIAECCDADCLADCQAASAANAEQCVVLPAPKTAEPDDDDGVALAVRIDPHPSPPRLSAVPRPAPLALPVDTPVRRYDRLLD